MVRLLTWITGRGYMQGKFSDRHGCCNAHLELECVLECKTQEMRIGAATPEQERIMSEARQVSDVARPGPAAPPVTNPVAQANGEPPPANQYLPPLFTPAQLRGMAYAAIGILLVLSVFAIA